MTGERIVCLSAVHCRHSPRFQRAVGLVLVALLVAETAPAGLARAGGSKRVRKGRKPAAAAVQDSPANAAETPGAQNKAPANTAESSDAFYARKRGVVALNTGHYAEAIKAFEEAYALNQDPMLLFNLAQAYRLAGQPGKALEACSSFLRSADGTKADRVQVEHFMAELEMIVYQLRVQRDLRQPQAPGNLPAITPPPPAAIEPPPLAMEDRSGDHKQASLDLAPRPERAASASLTASLVPGNPNPTKPFYRRAGFWVLAGGAVATGAVLLWLAERPSGLRAPTTTLGYQPAFP